MSIEKYVYYTRSGFSPVLARIAGTDNCSDNHFNIVILEDIKGNNFICTIPKDTLIYNVPIISLKDALINKEHLDFAREELEKRKGNEYNDI